MIVIQMILGKKTTRVCQSSFLNITLLQVESNNGTGNARSIGIEAATGKWIF